MSTAALQHNLTEGDVDAATRRLIHFPTEQQQEEEEEEDEEREEAETWEEDGDSKKRGNSSLYPLT